MKLRILSDLHLDYNGDADKFKLKDSMDFTILCGDISGDPKITRKWIKENVRRGVFVAGNHLVYNRQHKTIERLRKDMAYGFSRTDKSDEWITYLDVLTGTFHRKECGIHFIGTTLYTNFKYNDGYLFSTLEEEIVRKNMLSSLKFMNDFRWGKKEGGPLIPMDYKRWFEISMKAIEEKIDEIVKKEPDAKIVMVTHHCPSPKCISFEYRRSAINSSYVSNLEDFIQAHPNIKLWCCGHIHSCHEFKVGDCLVVANPRGYLSHGEGVGFDPELRVDTDTWEVIR